MRYYCTHVSPLHSFPGCHLVLLGQPIGPDLPPHLTPEAPVWLAMYKVPGAAVGLVHRGEVVWVHGYGVADERTRVPVTSDTVFSAASISKALTAWGVIRLVEKGAVNLDSSVALYLDRAQLSESPFGYEGVTVRRLLSHTAGVMQSFGDSRGIRVTETPGKRFLYSNGDYAALQSVIEHVSGSSFVAYMQTEILAPVGANQSSFELSGIVPGQRAWPYTYAGHPNRLYEGPNKGAVGLWTSAHDLARFVAAHMVGPGSAAGRGIVSPESLREMMQPSPPAKFYGLGYELGLFKDCAGHGGSWPGWQAQFEVCPGKGEGFIALTNSGTGSPFLRRVCCLWANQILGDPASGVCSHRNSHIVVGCAAALGAAWFYAFSSMWPPTFRLRLTAWKAAGIIVPLLLFLLWLKAVYTESFLDDASKTLLLAWMRVEPDSLNPLTTTLAAWSLMPCLKSFCGRRACTPQ